MCHIWLWHWVGLSWCIHHVRCQFTENYSQPTVESRMNVIRHFEQQKPKYILTRICVVVINNQRNEIHWHTVRLWYVRCDSKWNMQIDNEETNDNQSKRTKRNENNAYSRRTKVRVINCVEWKTMQNYVRIWNYAKQNRCISWEMCCVGKQRANVIMSSKKRCCTTSISLKMLNILRSIYAIRCDDTNAPLPFLIPI